MVILQYFKGNLAKATNETKDLLSKFLSFYKHCWFDLATHWPFVQLKSQKLKLQYINPTQFFIRERATRGITWLVLQENYNYILKDEKKLKVVLRKRTTQILIIITKWKDGILWRTFRGLWHFWIWMWWYINIIKTMKLWGEIKINYIYIDIVTRIPTLFLVG